MKEFSSMVVYELLIADDLLTLLAQSHPVFQKTDSYSWS